ncbi:hypothetical protein Pla175_18280 [Pirellulimonas nuda]|uniref:Alpha/beta hydrolase family protein n=1 Tax=Pirellulimonas nuda TaxID=2528009 RepID=A0A518DAD9_9BACT|nr:hypothetical protein [Pirellulimonas nuda]QDU88450.1 hypothetical protein Pla175_18280 [Pirellulimonas nuda]
MLRRHFLSALAVGQSLLPRLALGQDAAAAGAAAPYEADTLGALLDEGINLGIGILRGEYQEQIEALRTGDRQKLAGYADALVAKLRPLIATPLVGDQVAQQLMEDVPPELVHQAPGEPVYFVNGMFTSHEVARQEARDLAKRLGGGRPVYLFYNAGTDPRVDPKLAAADLDETYKDRVWPVYLHGLMTGGSYKAAAEKMFFGVSVLQHNPTTRQVAHFLYHHPESCVSIVGYSQGAMIVRNALYTLALLGKEKFVNEHVAFVAPGLPLADREVWPVPKKFTALADPKDPIPAIIGLRQPTTGWRELGLAHHRFYELGYLKLIKPEMLCTD